MTELDLLAEELAVSGRTLRRAAARGTIRAHEARARRVVVSPSERLYVRRHWPLLRGLLEALRTRPEVRLAVIYGSFARGEAGPESDLDILVRLRDDTYLARATLIELLQRTSGRRVQLVSLEQAEEAPLLLADILRDGRVLVDRERGWPALKRLERAIERRAREEDNRLDREAWAVDSLGDLA
jgi:predicted nucleotidyltransferase